MKTKSHHFSPQLLSMHRIQKLGLSWKDIFSPSLAIHANRELNMGKIKLIGFDMDYTLAVYKKLPMEALQYKLARKYLIENMNYPKELTKTIYDPNLLIRGLVIDRELGHVLKLDDQNYVTRAYHCRDEISVEQINHIYGSKRIKVGDNRYYSLDTFFSIPEACLFIDALECFYENNEAKSTTSGVGFNQVFSDIRSAMDSIHSDNSLKNIIRDNIENFIIRDIEIEATLRKLKHEGKKLFLLTNSDFNYTHTVLNYVFNCEQRSSSSWMELFDLIIVDAKKPQFFTKTEPFSILKTPSSDASERTILVGGNIHDFHRMCEVRGPEVLYVGDHIYGDIVRSKKDSLWRTCLIIKELNFDIRKTIEHKDDFKALRQIQNEQSLFDKRLMRLRTIAGILHNRLSTEESLASGETSLMEELKHEIKESTAILQNLKERHLLLNRHVEDKFHGRWGRLFRENRELSRFGAQVKQYACIYTDHIKNFLHYGSNHMFFARKEPMIHELDLE